MSYYFRTLMDVSYVYVKNNDSLKISDVYKDCIYYAKDTKLMVMDIYSDRNEMLHNFNAYIDNIKVLVNNIHVFIGNICYIYSVSYKKLKTELFMKDVPLKIKKVNGLFVILCPFSLIYIIKDETIDTVRIYEKSSKTEIVDLCTNEELTLVIGSDGQVFRSKSILYTNRIFLGHHEVIFPKTALLIPHEVEIYANKLFISDKTGVKIFRIRKNYLELFYTYENYNTKLLHGFNGIFCYGEQLVLLDDIPILLADDKIYRMVDDKAISRNKIYFLNRFSKLTKNKIETHELFKERNPDDRTEELFSEISLVQIFDIESFKQTVLDGLKSIFIKLDSLNKSLIEKASIVKDKEKLVVSKFGNLMERRKAVKSKISKLDEAIVSRIQEKKDVINQQLETKISEVRQRIKIHKHDDYIEKLKKLKLQNIMLKEQINNVYK